ncbi:MAG: histidine kinase [Cyclobacteriaceae bacterium]
MNIRELLGFKWYHHLIFWVAYVLFWSTRDLVHHDDYIDNVQLNTVSGSVYAIMAYLNIYLLVPKLLLRRHTIVYVCVLITLISVTALTVSQIIAYYLQPEYHDTALFFVSTRGIVVLHFEAVFVALITLAIVLVTMYFKQDSTTQELKKKNLETELSFLKNQINPHFLFNSLNSIYFLIPKQPKKAAEILLKFSDMLSHQLYEGNKDFIPLPDEVKYLENYMELEKIRQGDDLEVRWSIAGDTANHHVAPMIFLTFLENAFKHGQGSDSKSVINGNISANQSEMTFAVTNKLGENGHKMESGNGVGLENTKRRLALLYPDKHELVISQNDQQYSVNLTLKTNGH